MHSEQLHHEHETHINWGEEGGSFPPIRLEDDQMASLRTINLDWYSSTKLYFSHPQSCFDRVAKLILPTQQSRSPSPILNTDLKNCVDCGVWQIGGRTASVITVVRSEMEYRHWMLLNVDLCWRAPEKNSLERHSNSIPYLLTALYY